MNNESTVMFNASELDINPATPRINKFLLTHLGNETEIDISSGSDTQNVDSEIYSSNNSVIPDPKIPLLSNSLKEKLKLDDESLELLSLQSTDYVNQTLQNFNSQKENSHLIFSENISLQLNESSISRNDQIFSKKRKNLSLDSTSNDSTFVNHRFITPKLEKKFKYKKTRHSIHFSDESFNDNTKSNKNLNLGNKNNSQEIIENDQDINYTIENESLKFYQDVKVNLEENNSSSRKFSVRLSNETTLHSTSRLSQSNETKSFENYGYQNSELSFQKQSSQNCSEEKENSQSLSEKMYSQIHKNSKQIDKCPFNTKKTNIFIDFDSTSNDSTIFDQIVTTNFVNKFKCKKNVKMYFSDNSFNNSVTNKKPNLPKKTNSPKILSINFEKKQDNVNQTINKPLKNKDETSKDNLNFNELINSDLRNNSNESRHDNQNFKNIENLNNNDIELNVSEGKFAMVDVNFELNNKSITANRRNSVEYFNNALNETSSINYRFTSQECGIDKKFKPNVNLSIDCKNFSVNEIVIDADKKSNAFQKLENSNLSFQSNRLDEYQTTSEDSHIIQESDVSKKINLNRIYSTNVAKEKQVEERTDHCRQNNVEEELNFLQSFKDERCDATKFVEKPLNVVIEHNLNEKLEIYKNNSLRDEFNFCPTLSVQNNALQHKSLQTVLKTAEMEVIARKNISMGSNGSVQRTNICDDFISEGNSIANVTNILNNNCTIDSVFISPVTENTVDVGQNSVLISKKVTWDSNDTNINNFKSMNNSQMNSSLIEKSDVVNNVPNSESYHCDLFQNKSSQKMNSLVLSGNDEEKNWSIEKDESTIVLEKSVDNKKIGTLKSEICMRSGIIINVTSKKDTSDSKPTEHSKIVEIKQNNKSNNDITNKSYTLNDTELLGTSSDFQDCHDTDTCSNSLDNSNFINKCHESKNIYNNNPMNSKQHCIIKFSVLEKNVPNFTKINECNFTKLGTEAYVPPELLNEKNFIEDCKFEQNSMQTDKGNAPHKFLFAENNLPKKYISTPMFKINRNLKQFQNESNNVLKCNNGNSEEVDFLKPNDKQRKSIRFSENIQNDVLPFSSIVTNKFDYTTASCGVPILLSNTDPCIVGTEKNSGLDTLKTSKNIQVHQSSLLALNSTITYGKIVEFSKSTSDSSLPNATTFIASTDSTVKSSTCNNIYITQKDESFSLSDSKEITLYPNTTNDTNKLEDTVISSTANISWNEVNENEITSHNTVDNKDTNDNTSFDEEVFKTSKFNITDNSQFLKQRRSKIRQINKEDKELMKKVQELPLWLRNCIVSTNDSILQNTSFQNTTSNIINDLIISDESMMFKRRNRNLRKTLIRKKSSIQFPKWITSDLKKIINIKSSCSTNYKIELKCANEKFLQSFKQLVDSVIKLDEPALYHPLIQHLKKLMFSLKICQTNIEFALFFERFTPLQFQKKALKIFISKCSFELPLTQAFKTYGVE